jgi:hypothetical protein
MIRFKAKASITNAFIVDTLGVIPALVTVDNGIWAKADTDVIERKKVNVAWLMGTNLLEDSYVGARSINKVAINFVPSLCIFVYREGLVCRITSFKILMADFNRVVGLKVMPFIRGIATAKDASMVVGGRCYFKTLSDQC